MSISVMTLVYKARLGCPNRKAVALKLADCSDDDGRNIWPAVGTIADQCELSPRTVQIKLSELREMGIIRFADGAASNGGRGHTTHYEFEMPALVQLAYGDAATSSRTKGAKSAPFSGDENPAADSPLEAVKGAADDIKGADDALKGAAAAPEPSRTIQNLPQTPLSGASSDHCSEFQEVDDGPVESGDEQPGSKPNAEATARAKKLRSAIEAKGAPREPVQYLVWPILSQRRFSASDAEGELVAICREARNLPPRLLTAASKIVLDAGVQTVKAQRIREAVDAVRKAGEMIVITKREHADQWAAWRRHYAADGKAGRVALMDGAISWQVPAAWPPSSGDGRAA